MENGQNTSVTFYWWLNYIYIELQHCRRQTNWSSEEGVCTFKGRKRQIGSPTAVLTLSSIDKTYKGWWEVREDASKGQHTIINASDEDGGSSMLMWA